MATHHRTTSDTQFGKHCSTYRALAIASQMSAEEGKKYPLSVLLPLISLLVTNIELTLYCLQPHFANFKLQQQLK